MTDGPQTESSVPRVPEDEVGETPSMFVARVALISNVDVAAVGLLLERDLQRMCSSTLDSSTSPVPYIWDREPPAVRICEEDSRLLNVIMRVHDCVDDEWFLTYLLREWSKVHPDVCISVADEDGEFLLIEAADVLPAWVQPDTSENRVWINGGHLHLVSPNVAPDALSVEQATHLVLDASKATQAPTAVEEKAFERLNAYPEAAQAHHHTTLAFVPPAAARVFNTYPQCVAEAVQALTTRDVVSMRSLQRTSHLHVTGCQDETGPPAPPATDVVLVPVRMTRHLYARISFDKFFPPAALGRRWQRHVELHRLALSGKNAHRITDTQIQWGRWCDTGAKLTYGLAMWLDDMARRQTNLRSPNKLMDAQRYEKFIAALTDLGYFGDEMRHSAEWKAREAQALRTAARLDIPNAEEPLGAYQDILLVMKANDTNILALDTHLPIKFLQQHEESDTWLSMAPEDIEAMLSGRSEAEAESATIDKFQDFMSKMQTFLTKQGDVEGALLDDDFADGEEACEFDSDEEECKDALVEPLSPDAWGAEKHQAAKKGHQELESRKAVDASVRPSASPDASRLSGLSQLDRLDGDSDPDDASLPSDRDDAPDERAARHCELELDEETSDVDDGPDEHDMNDFLEFTRSALGLTESQYAEILEERRKRGAFVPPAPEQTVSTEQGTSFASLDAALDTMERELAYRTQMSKSAPADDHDDDEELNPEETELLQHLLVSGVSLPDSLKRFASEHDVNNDEVEMLGHFLESFKAQGGRPGPVTTLSQRLGVGSLPRDSS